MNYNIENNVIYINKLRLTDLLSLLATIHSVINDKGFYELVLDFSNCSTIDSAAALALCPLSCKLRENNIDIILNLPNNNKRKKLFINCNWAHFIDPKNHSLSSPKRGKQIPATQYKNIKTQSNKMKL